MPTSRDTIQPHSAINPSRATAPLPQARKRRATQALPTVLLKTMTLMGLEAGLIATAKAAPFTGVCPVLGSTQPSYSTLPLAPSIDPSTGKLIASEIAIQAPTRVSVDGQDYPICAVYMSINDAFTTAEDSPLVADQAIGVPEDVKNDLYFPNLREQPWYTAPGGSFAEKIAEALVANGYWDSADGIHYWGNPSAATEPNEGVGVLVNPNPLPGGPDESTLSAYFLWSEVGGATNAKGKARYLLYNTKQAAADINWQARDADNLDPNTKYWYWVLDAPGPNAAEVPGPLPLLGTGAALAWSRRLRRRIRVSP